MPALYAATGDDLARITQRGDEWPVTLMLERRGIQCLALDPRAPLTVFAGSRGQGVWKSGNGGESWANLELPERDVFSLAVSPVNGAVYAGCEPSRIFVSEDGAETWRELEALRDLPSAPTWRFPPRPWRVMCAGFRPARTTPICFWWGSNSVV